MIAGGKRYIAYPSRSDVIKIWGIGDLHFGNVGCAIKELRKDIEKIEQDPYSFWLGLGDYAEMISPGDPRFDPAVIEEWVGARDIGKLGSLLMARVKETLWPIRKKCLGLLYGNHEWKYMVQKERQELHDWLCIELGVPNMGYSCLFDLVFLRTEGDVQLRQDRVVDAPAYTVRVFAHHGAGAAQTAGGKINRLEGFMHRFVADVYFCAHIHDRKSTTIDTIDTDAACLHIIAKRKYGVITGSYLRAYPEGAAAGYAERAGYAPTPIGAACVEIKPNTEEIRI